MQRCAVVGSSGTVAGEARNGDMLRALLWRGCAMKHAMASGCVSRYPSPMQKCLLLGFILLASVARGDDDVYAAERAAFVRAYAQAAAPGGDAHAADSEALRTYPLYPYLQTARIRKALAAAGPELAPVDERAATFVEYYGREPVGRLLRAAWLRSLATRQLWPTFVQRYRDEEADVALRCLNFNARIALGSTEGLAEAIAAQWLTPRSLPDCEGAFEWLKAQNALTPDLIEQRVRLALKENSPAFARQIAAALPSDRAAPLFLWASLLETPQKTLDQILATPHRAVEQEALLAGWSRLARIDRDAAIARFELLRKTRAAGDADIGPYALALALPLAWDRRSESLRYFQLVPGALLDDSALEWQVRAALWAENWGLAAKTIAAMSDQQRSTARWRYWAARAAERGADPKLARQLYESVLADDNYYAMMAAARLERPIAPHPERVPADRVQLAQIGQLPAFLRARELRLADLGEFAVAEWAHGVRALSEQARVQAIHLAAQWGWYEQAISTASQQRVFNDYELLYPRPYDAQVRAAAKLTKLPPELIYGVMRQESLYRRDAISSAGALGLLQMLPETARRTARQWQRPRPAATDLFDPNVNVTLGAAHLRSLMDRFGGQTVVALAGYNAGPNAALRWLPGQSIDPDVWIENIPYNETRTYVQRILWHSVVFNWLRTGEPARVDAWLARVVPPGQATVLGSNGD